MQHLLVIVGPTASGKSDLAVQLAKRLNGEVISADSRQVYKGLNIGTGKITKKEMRGVKHHLLDVSEPAGKRFSVVDYVHLAEKAIADIASRGKLPIICGGTGFYIDALIYGVLMPDVPPNEHLRKTLASKSAPELIDMLRAIDPARADSMSHGDDKNARRLILAIEIAKALGAVPPIIKTKKYNARIIGIDIDPAKLRERIHARLLKRMRQGMVAEAKRLHEGRATKRTKNKLRALKPVSWKRMEELGLEYRYLARYLQGKIDKKRLTMMLYAQ